MPTASVMNGSGADLRDGLIAVANVLRDPAQTLAAVVRDLAFAGMCAASLLHLRNRTSS